MTDINGSYYCGKCKTKFTINVKGFGILQSIRIGDLCVCLKKKKYSEG